MSSNVDYHQIKYKIADISQIIDTHTNKYVVEKRIKNIDETDKDIERGCCSECGEGYDNEPEWLYNTECEVCGHPIPDNLIVKRP